jgi:hypothetical protein
MVDVASLQNRLVQYVLTSSLSGPCLKHLSRLHVKSRKIFRVRECTEEHGDNLEAELSRYMERPENLGMFPCLTTTSSIVVFQA